VVYPVVEFTPVPGQLQTHTLEPLGTQVQGGLQLRRLRAIRSEHLQDTPCRIAIQLCLQHHHARNANRRLGEVHHRTCGLNDGLVHRLYGRRGIEALLFLATGADDHRIQRAILLRVDGRCRTG